MIQRQSQTINPAGNPFVQRTAPKQPAYTRAEFIRDLEKTAAKQSTERSEQSDEEES